MRRAAAFALAAAVLVAGAGTAEATFPKLLSARALPPGAVDVSLAGGFGNTDPDYWAVWGATRRGLFRSVDAGVRAGYLSTEQPADTERSWLAGADARVQVLRESIDIPLDFAVDVGWTVARPNSNTWSDLSFAGLFSWSVSRETLRDWLFGFRGSLTGTLGVELVYLGGRGRPGPDETAAYGILNVDVRLPGGLSFVPEIKLGSDTVLGASLGWRF